jgi:hypothetical protein
MLPTSLQVRYATLRDIPTLTQIFDYIYHYRDRYPDDHIFFWQQRLKSDLFDPSIAFLVAEIPRPLSNPANDDLGESTELVAFATWKLKGPCTHGQKVLSWNEFIISTVMRKSTASPGRSVSFYLQYDIVSGAISRVENFMVAQMYGRRRDANWQRRQRFIEVGSKLDSE